MADTENIIQQATYAERRCVTAVTLPDPWMFAQCALDVGHEGDHKAIIEWDDDDL